MNPIALYFVSGDSLYLGSALLLTAIVASPHLKRRWMIRSRNIAAWLAVALIVMACPPFRWIVYAVFLAAFVVWFALVNGEARSGNWARLRSSVAIVLFLSVLAVSASELAHRRMPSISGTPSDHLTVIGDSLSAGIDSRTPAWPQLYEQIAGVSVKNLSKAGAGVAEGRAMADKFTPDDRVILIELGGNDLLADAPSEEFERNLDLLLSKIATPGRTIVMFELPLLPNSVQYGRIQRRLAAKYGVWLIPKHYLVAVIGGADATLDGLHLSATGARRMASLVATCLSSVLKSPA